MSSSIQEYNHDGGDVFKNSGDSEISPPKTIEGFTDRDKISPPKNMEGNTDRDSIIERKSDCYNHNDFMQDEHAVIQTVRVDRDLTDVKNKLDMQGKMMMTTHRDQIRSKYSTLPSA